MAYFENLYYSDPPNDFHVQVKINSTTGSEIVTATDVKDFARIDTTDDDTIIGRMITQARIWCENYIGKDIVAKNRTYYTPFVDVRINLPFAPVASISTVTVDGSTATYTARGLDNEIIELDSLPSKEVKITYVTAGLDDSLLKQAVLQLTSTYYDNRADFSVMQGVNFVEVPSNVKAILASYKNMFI